MRALVRTDRRRRSIAVAVCHRDRVDSGTWPGGFKWATRTRAPKRRTRARRRTRRRRSSLP